jgi:hypothetical protein
MPPARDHLSYIVNSSSNVDTGILLELLIHFERVRSSDESRYENISYDGEAV